MSLISSYFNFAYYGLSRLSAFVSAFTFITMSIRRKGRIKAPFKAWLLRIHRLGILTAFRQER